MASVRVLKPGYVEPAGRYQFRADCSITLVHSSVNVVVDTGNPADGPELVRLLQAEELTPRDISVVVCTHGDADHVGNNGLFPHALFVVGEDICQGDVFTVHNFRRSPYVIDDEVKVIPTPGHSGRDVSVLVATAEGLVAIVGDLFENEHDRGDELQWRKWSRNPRSQARSRDLILGQAAFIVPGHGGMFRVRRS